jgi:photosystem II stability/assembly factor-like uncharacterized protein
MRPLIIVAALVAVVTAQGAWLSQPSGTSQRLRGVSAVSSRVAWASGAAGTVVRTVDGGATWAPVPPTGTGELDFRDIEAVSGETAFVLAIGPGERSRIYKTTDGGRTWALQFQNNEPRAFYDAIAFWDESRGLAFGDPVDGKFTVIRTSDGGSTWTAVPPANLPPALDGEGAFAASGTCLAVAGTAHAWFGTGGAARARVFRSVDGGVTWEAADTPVSAGSTSAGVFSLAFSDEHHGVAAGGDYRKEAEAADNFAVTRDGGRTWTLGTRFRGFRSALAFVPGSSGRTLLAVGPAGADRSADGGTTWTPLGDDGFHAMSVARDGTVWAVGENGRVGKLPRPTARFVSSVSRGRGTSAVQ